MNPQLLSHSRTRWTFMLHVVRFFSLQYLLILIWVYPIKCNCSPEIVVSHEVFLCNTLFFYIYFHIHDVRIRQHNTNTPKHNRPPPLTVPCRFVDAIWISQLIYQINAAHLLVVFVNVTQLQESQLLDFTTIDIVHILFYFHSFHLVRHHAQKTYRFCFINTWRN